MSSPLITLLAMPKPFDGHIGIIQRNAITSWTKLSPRPEIFLFGGEEARRNLDIYGGVPHAFTLLNATHELRGDGSIRAVHYRAQKHRVQLWLWRTLVQRTAPLRKRLGLQRSKKKSNHNRDAQ